MAFLRREYQGRPAVVGRRLHVGLRISTPQTVSSAPPPPQASPDTHTDTPPTARILRVHTVLTRAARAHRHPSSIQSDRRARIRMERERTLASSSWRRQPSRPNTADSIKAVLPSLSAACTLACAFRHHASETVSCPQSSRIHCTFHPAHTIPDCPHLVIDDFVRFSLALSRSTRTPPSKQGSADRPTRVRMAHTRAPWLRAAGGGSHRRRLTPNTARPSRRRCSPLARWPAHVDRTQSAAHHPTPQACRYRAFTLTHTHTCESPHLACDRRVRPVLLPRTLAQRAHTTIQAGCGRLADTCSHGTPGHRGADGGTRRGRFLPR